MAARYYFFVWHLFYGVIVACLAARLYQNWIDSAYSPSWLLAIGAAVSLLLMVYFTPSNKQLYMLDIQERKKSCKRRDKEMLFSNSAFAISLLIGCWQFIVELGETVSNVARP